MRALFLLTLLFPTLLFAAPANRFDPKTVEKFKGKISSIQTFSNITRPRRHKQIMLRTEQGEMVVELGPQWYLEERDIALYPGAEVEVTGSVVKANGSRYVIATSITVEETTFELRDTQGHPLWAARGLRDHFRGKGLRLSPITDKLNQAGIRKQ